MYVYGGMDEQGSPLSDMYMLDLDRFSWTKVDAEGGRERMHHSAIMTQQGIMIAFGGWQLSDVACYDVRNGSWYECLTETTPAPSIRYGHSAVFSPLQQMVVYGGRNSAGT